MLSIETIIIKEKPRSAAPQAICKTQQLVRKERLELSRGYPLEPKSSASTNSATFATRHSRLLLKDQIPAGRGRHYREELAGSPPKNPSFASTNGNFLSECSELDLNPEVSTRFKTPYNAIKDLALNKGVAINRFNRRYFLLYIPVLNHLAVLHSENINHRHFRSVWSWFGEHVQNHQIILSYDSLNNNF